MRVPQEQVAASAIEAFWRSSRLALWLVLPLVVFVACSEGAAESEVVDISPPASAESGQPHPTVDADGKLWLSWIEPTGAEDEHTLKYASLEGDSWSEPASAATGEDWFVNWADVPSILPLPDGRLAAHYLVSNGPNIFAYDVRITQQNGAGEWQEAITPHTDGTQTEHGFVSMLPWDGDDIVAIWLDGREMDLDADDEHDHGSGAMTLRGAVLDANNQTKQKALLDDHVCECCPTSGVMTDEGALFAYRDRTDDEIRNMSLVRFHEGAWSEPYELHDDGWRIEGCPVNGPALAAQGENVVATWYTAPDEQAEVRVAFSDDNGNSFSEPITLDDDRPGGQVDAVMLDDGTAIISWYGRDGESSALLASKVAPDGTIGEPYTVVAPMPAMRTGIPRMVESNGMLYFTWVGEEPEADTERVRTKRLSHALLQ